MLFRSIYVRDTLKESPFAFVVPFQLLSLWQSVRRQQLREFGLGTSSNAFNKALYENKLQHLDMISKALTIYQQYVTCQGDYAGLTFRPSTYRKSPELQFVPVNMQQQYMEVAEDEKFTKPICQFTHVTFGAPAAHIYRFKNGTGIRQLIEQRAKLEEALSRGLSGDLQEQ